MPIRSPFAHGAALICAANLGLALSAIWLWRRAPAAYYRLIQEDTLLEWASFWGFALAGALFLAAAWRAQGGLRRRWFFAGLGLFCLLVGLEEISWGQRLFYFRAPEAWIAANHQSEANLHNFARPGILAIGFQAALLLYGLALPLLAATGAGRRLCQRLGLIPPPRALVPSFGVILALLWLVPEQRLSHSVPFGNEVPEAMAALSFAAAGLAALRPLSAARALGLVLLLPGLGAFTLGVQPLLRPDPTAEIALAEAELKALALDLWHGKNAQPRSPGLDMRLLHFVQAGNAPRLSTGAFAARVGAGDLPPERQRLFLDPWHQPYWIADLYHGGGRWMYLYSHGPNARADQVVGRRRGDDVIYMILGDPRTLPR